MQSTGGVADRFAPLAARLERRLPGGLPFAVRFWDESELRPEAEGSGDTIVVRDSRALSYIAAAPNLIGLGRAWVAGDLGLDGDLERALRASELLRGLRLDLGDRIASLRAAARAGAFPLRRPAPPQSEAQLGGRLHSIRRDRDAARHHYDVSNDFYRLVLGPTMVYSCAYFDSDADTLEHAQERKLDVGLPQAAAWRMGRGCLTSAAAGGRWSCMPPPITASARVGVTLSEPQAELARERIRAAGLADRCEIRVQDYRAIADGPYDKIASIGMYEHVGAARLDRYMQRLRQLVRPGGLILNHGIVRASRRGPRRATGSSAATSSPTASCTPSAASSHSLERAGLELRDSESLREHYALTLRRWVANLAANREAALAAAGAERERIWCLYMTGSALAFERGDISLQQLLAAAPGARVELPLARPAFTV